MIVFLSLDKVEKWQLDVLPQKCLVLQSPQNAKSRHPFHCSCSRPYPQCHRINWAGVDSFQGCGSLSRSSKMFNMSQSWYFTVAFKSYPHLQLVDMLFDNATTLDMAPWCFSRSDAGHLFSVSNRGAIILWQFWWENDENPRYTFCQTGWFPYFEKGLWECRLRDQ